MSEGGERASGRAYDVAEGVAVPGMVSAKSLEPCVHVPLDGDLPESCAVTVACGVAIAVAVAQRVA